MPEFSGSIVSPGLDAAVEVLARMAKDDRELRILRAQNAPMAVGYEQGTLTATLMRVIADAQSGSSTYSFLAVFFDEASGKGRYQIVPGQLPSAAGSGLPIPSGGSVIYIAGAVNIQQFKMIAETGQTLNYAWVLFV